MRPRVVPVPIVLIVLLLVACRTTGPQPPDPRHRGGGPYSTDELPEFPWPPPAPSTRTALPDTLLGADFHDHPTLGGAWEALHRALTEAGYLEQGVFRVPDGFAIVTRAERTLANGEPDPDDRWSLDRFPPGRWSLLQYLRALLTVDPGRFRVLVFAVTTDRSGEVADAVSSETALDWVQSGGLEPPAKLKAEPFGPDHLVQVLIYEFSRPDREAEVEQIQPAAHPAEVHLRASGVLAALGAGR